MPVYDEIEEVSVFFKRSAETVLYILVLGACCLRNALKRTCNELRKTLSGISAKSVNRVVTVLLLALSLCMVSPDKGDIFPGMPVITKPTLNGVEIDWNVVP
ncbi:hypothetical protein CDAR_596771 [Caerostris darwini]|uniref:Uncharacterized protein n=1 Tax=Caerostris darwini TaxID=1538125 RepID=A0AAV4WCF1_9ARAC|nr:hypothetical protein CDAR_596771 [Caerostris darwini]